MSPANHQTLANDVAKQLERRRMRRKLLLWAAIVAVLAACVTYLTCGHGWGFGGKGMGEGRGAGSQLTVDAAAARCTIRIAASGITVAGQPVTRDEAVAACKATTGAEVIVTGDARQGDWDDLRTALEAAGVTLYMKQGSAAL